jgi:ribosomal protein L11 methyltransferase
MPLVELKAEISAGAVEAVDEVLLELGVDGWSLLEDAIARRAWIVGIFRDRAVARRRWSVLRELLPAMQPAPAEPELRRLPEADWRDSYRAHFHAWTFGRLHWVPEWERSTFRLPPGHAVLWLDPGLAFGTGNHETTRLCIERLVAREGAGRVIDAGCGSGILALSACLLGFDPVAAFDCDPEAVRVSRQNAALNGLTGRVDFFAADLAAGLAGRRAEVVLANIQSDVLRQHARTLLAAVAPSGTLVLSGILAAELGVVRAAFTALAPDWPVESRTLGEWSDLCLREPSSPGRPAGRPAPALRLRKTNPPASD